MKKNKIVNPSEITQSQFSNKSAAQRGVDVGISPKPLGLIKNTLTRVSREEKNHVAVVFYNQTGAVVFVKFGMKDMTAPATAADGFPVLPGEKCTLNSGEFTHAMSSSAAGIYAYSAHEEE